MSAHRLTIRIYYEDTDAGGVVYHTGYLRFMERGRTEWLRARGWTLDQVVRLGVILVVRHIDVKFKSPAVLQDLVEVETRYSHHTPASIIFRQSIYLRARLAGSESADEKRHPEPSERQPDRRSDSAPLLCTAKVRCVCRRVDVAKARALPTELIRSLCVH